MLRSGPTNGHDEDDSAGTTRDAEISEWIQGDADASVFVITNFCSYASTNTISKREHVSSRRFDSDPAQHHSVCGDASQLMHRRILARHPLLQ